MQDKKNGLLQVCTLHKEEEITITVEPIHIVDTIGNHLTVLIVDVSLIQKQFCKEIPQLGHKQVSVHIRVVSTVRGSTVNACFVFY